MSSAVSGEQGVDGGRRSKLRGRWRFYWGALGWITPAVCRVAPNRKACGRFRFCSARVGSDDGRWRFCWGVLGCLTPAVCRIAPNRTACGRFRVCSARVGIALARSRGGMGLSCFAGSLRDCAFLCGDPDGGTTGVVYTKRSAAFGWALLLLWFAYS